MSSTPEIGLLRLRSRRATCDSLSKTGSGLGGPGGQRSPTILVVDDEPSLLEVRRVVLEKLGYAAIVADSGQKALEVIRTSIVDVIVLDYRMPGMDGGQTAREIRKLDRAIPIILSTASIAIPNAVLGLFSAFVPKGSGPGCLLEVLEEQVQRVCSHPLRRVGRRASKLKKRGWKSE